jgi:hypothetical protein
VKKLFSIMANHPLSATSRELDRLRLIVAKRVEMRLFTGAS